MSVVTMNLADSDGGMTYFSSKPSSAPPPPVNESSHQYSAKIEEEKKIDNTIINNKQMDSTPISDIFSGNDMINDQTMMMPQDPRAIASSQQQYQTPMMVAAPQAKASAAPNLMNLTDEQLQAVFVGVCAIIAFSSPVQDKLANFIPTFVADNGVRSNTGLVVTGLVAAVVFYFGKRMVLK